jgi:hypothetical protein
LTRRPTRRRRRVLSNPGGRLRALFDFVGGFLIGSALIRSHSAGARKHTTTIMLRFSLFLLNPDWLRKISGPRNCVMTRTQKPPLSLPSKSTPRCATASESFLMTHSLHQRVAIPARWGATSRAFKADVAIGDEYPTVDNLRFMRPVSADRPWFQTGPLFRPEAAKKCAKSITFSGHG